MHLLVINFLHHLVIYYGHDKNRMRARRREQLVQGGQLQAGFHHQSEGRGGLGLRGPP